MRIISRFKNKSAKRIAAMALIVSACSFGALGVSAASASAFTTPYYKMNCQTWVTGTTSNGACKGFGKWRMVTSCSWGFTYNSPWYIGSDFSWTYANPVTCAWGVNSITIQESVG